MLSTDSPVNSRVSQWSPLSEKQFERFFLRITGDGFKLRNGSHLPELQESDEILAITLQPNGRDNFGPDIIAGYIIDNNYGKEGKPDYYFGAQICRVENTLEENLAYNELIWAYQNTTGRKLDYKELVETEWA